MQIFFCRVFDISFFVMFESVINISEIYLYNNYLMRQLCFRYCSFVINVGINIKVVFIKLNIVKIQKFSLFSKYLWGIQIWKFILFNKYGVFIVSQVFFCVLMRKVKYFIGYQFFGVFKLIVCVGGEFRDCFLGLSIKVE